MVVVKGIYFNSEHEEILALGTEDAALPDAEGWVKVSDDLDFGLVGIRTLLIESGLTTDARTVDWYGMKSRSGRSDPVALRPPDP